MCELGIMLCERVLIRCELRIEMCKLEIIMCEANLERCEDKIVMGGIDKVQDIYKRNKCNVLIP